MLSAVLTYSVTKNTATSLKIRLKYLKNRVESIKANSQIGVTFMKMETRDRLLKKDGENRIAELIRLLMKDERLDDLKKMSENPDYRKQLLQEYNL